MHAIIIKAAQEVFYVDLVGKGSKWKYDRLKKKGWLVVCNSKG